MKILGKRGNLRNNLAYTIIFLGIFLFIFTSTIIISSYCSTNTGTNSDIGVSQYIMTNSPKFIQYPMIKILNSKFGNFLDYSTGWTKNVFGFNKNSCDFFNNLVFGILTGIWIYLSYYLISLWISLILRTSFARFKKQAESDEKRLESSWLNFIGGRIYKIIPLAIAFAVLMQIPIINTFIDIISFNTRPIGLNWFLRSIILAFYIGLLPGAIESYTRYKLRMHYYEQLVSVKYGMKALKTLGRA